MIDELTEREKQAAVLAASGMSNREVGKEMGIKESAVKQYLHRVYDKTGTDRPLLRSLSFPASR